MGKAMLAFVFGVTFIVNGAYMWQAWTLKERLKAKGIIEGDDDERWTNLQKYSVN